MSVSHPDHDAALAQLRGVARTFGFFYLTDHGIPQERIDTVITLSKRFFALPEHQKLEIEMKNSPQDMLAELEQAIAAV